MNANYTNKPMPLSVMFYHCHLSLLQGRICPQYSIAMIQNSENYLIVCVLVARNALRLRLGRRNRHNQVYHAPHIIMRMKDNGIRAPF